MAAVAADRPGTHDQAKVEEIFGPERPTSSGPATTSRTTPRTMRVKAMIDTAWPSTSDSDDETVVAELGKDKWPFPIPLVKTAEGWRFDLEQGKDELLSRRIGRNELRVIETLYEYVEAQKEYFAKGRDGNPPAYAQKVRSSAGKHDGLFGKPPEGGGGEPASARSSPTRRRPATAAGGGRAARAVPRLLLQDPDGAGCKRAGRARRATSTRRA